MIATPVGGYWRCRTYYSWQVVMAVLLLAAISALSPCALGLTSRTLTGHPPLASRAGERHQEPATFDLPDCLPRTAMIVLTYLSSPRLPVARLVEEATSCGAAPRLITACSASSCGQFRTTTVLWAALHTRRRERDCAEMKHSQPAHSFTGGVQDMDERRRVHELRHHPHGLGDTQRDQGGGLPLKRTPP